MRLIQWTYIALISCLGLDGYLIVVTRDEPEGHILFDSKLTAQSDGDGRREYWVDFERSGGFIKRFIRVNRKGEVVLRRRLECDGLNHPNLFTVYVESVSNGTLEYVSVPLRILVRGCDELLSFRDGVVVNEGLNQIAEAKKWPSETLASFSFPLLKDGSGHTLRSVCLRPSQSVGHLHSLLPASLRSTCSSSIHFGGPDDPRFSVETASGGDLVISKDAPLCLDQASTTTVSIPVSYSCSGHSQIISPGHTSLRVSINFKEVSSLSDIIEMGRVRRTLRPGDPSFEKPLYIASVQEEQSPGLEVCTVAVKQSAVYSMVSLLDSRSAAMFTIGANDGIVTTSARLDRETMDVHYFRVTAVSEDGSLQARSATTTLQINVGDVNDHAPVFESSSGGASLSESAPVGSVVAQLRATDLDVGINAQIEYSLSSVDSGGLDTGDGVFAIDSSTGLITTRHSLDRETAEVYTIVAEASDLAQPPTSRLTSTTSLVMTVLDENDNYPQFDERTVTVYLPEETPSLDNPVVVTVRATDSDSGPNGALRFAIIGGNTQGQFAIDSQSGEIALVKALDYESIRSYRLVIRAQDGGSPGKSNTTQVLINVKDFNDNAPRFYTSLFQESVSEDVPVGFSIVRVQAYDSDEGENSEIDYKISSHFNPAALPISVDPPTGWLFTNKALDRETESRLSFEVLAVDRGNPPKTGTATVSISIQDTNDNDPSFSPKEYSVNIGEDSAPGTSVVAVHATDPDENPRLHYEIASGNTRGRFAVTTQNGRGLITVAQPLDYKQERRFILVVKATDSGGRFDSANIYINITDANTFSPVFDNAPYSATLPEDSKIGTTVLVVSATDGDTGLNAQIVYSLTSETDRFTINSDTGAIVTTGELDRETTSGYLLSVTAKDNGTPQLSDTTDVEITVTDVNDNPPKFFQESYSVSVSEDVPIGTSVVQVGAADPDSGLNGRVRYSLENPTDTFIMEPITGVVRVNRGLDRESVSSYQLIAIASDRATPPLSSTVTISVTVDDVNDSPPSFTSDQLMLYIAENSPIGSTVGEIRASDPDVGLNAVIQYSIIGGEDLSSFSLQARPGLDFAELITLVELDYESDKKEFHLVVRATSAPLRSDASLKVIVTDVNDNAPVLPDFQVVFNNFREHFPSGPIGQIPASDADVSDKLKYRLLSGNNARLVSLNETSGELSLSPQLNTNVPKVATMEVSVSDGVNEVKAWMELTVRLITEEMLTNSVTVRLAEMTIRAFLSPLYSYFVEAVAAIVPCPKHNVYVFSVQEDPDTPDQRVLNVSFSVKSPDGSLMPAQLLQEKVHLNRLLLNKLSTLKVLQFEDNLCVSEPCLNFEECLTVLKFGSAAPFLASDSMLFRPIHPETTFSCRCPVGFVGTREHYLCDTEIDLCYSNPCQNGGTCRRSEGSYTCVCPKGFTGRECESPLENDCPKSCPSGFTCSPLEEGGYTCESCAQPGSSFQNYGRSCEARARSFVANSYLTFTPIRQRNRFRISLKFATVAHKGLLLYNGRYNQLHDFIALELVGGSTIEFSFSLGSGVTTVVAVSDSPLNDGSWHTVSVQYYNRSATVSLDQCDTVVAVKFGDQLNMTCAASATQELEARCSIVTESCHRFLDLTGPLQLGGLPPSTILSRSLSHLSSTSFTGCLADVTINDRLLDLNSFVANNGTKIGCPERSDAFCASSPCLNGGTCSESWGSYLCECEEGWSSSDCSVAVPRSWSFSGDGQLVFNPLLRPIQLPWEVHFSFKTTLIDGFILGVSIGQNSSAFFTLENGLLKYSIDEDEVVLSSWKAADGKWHRASASVSPAGTLTLTLDTVRTSGPVSIRTNPQKQFIGRVIVGLETGKQPFIGCIKDIRLGSALGLQLVQNPITAMGVGDGCSNEEQCHDTTCPPYSSCSSDKCSCLAGRAGPNCVRICSLNPCEHGTCLDDKRSPLGYSCACNGTSFTGDYCDQQMTSTCPSTWWGTPHCGPCSCPTHLGFSPHCHPTTGVCSCKENHYLHSESAGCLPCSCYPPGSLSSKCHPKTGQCECKPGVVGLHCDQCPNAFAQVTSRGCEVVYGGCPRSRASKIWWERTEYGMTATMPCPTGSVGTASRLCDKVLPGWRDPDVFNCTSNDFIPLRRLLNQLETGDVSLNTYVATETSRSLVSALNTSSLYGADVLVTSELVSRLLKYEGNLTGLSLSHVQYAGYIDSLVWVVGELLSERTVELWPRVQRLTGRHPSDIHSLFTLYMKSLAVDMRDTYTPPFETISNNMILGLDTVSPESIFGYEVLNRDTSESRFKEIVVLPDTSNILQPPLSSPRNSTASPTIIFPKYNNYLKVGPKFDEFSKILVPLRLLGIREVVSGDVINRKPSSSPSASATLAYAFYKSGGLYMNKFDHTVSSRWGVALQLGSAVLSVVATTKDGAVISSGLKTPVRLQLWIPQMQSPRSNPQCVRWTHVRGFGEWTRAGCLTHLPEDDWWRRPVLMVNCTCTTLSTHAVVIDLLAERYVREPSEAEEVYTWVGLTVALWCLSMTLLIVQMTSRGVTGKVNHSTIQANFSFCLLTSVALYLIALKGSSLTSNTVWCKLLAILLHYTWLCSLSWSLVYSLHLYGMLTRLRDSNRDPMGTRIAFAYGLPGVIVGLSAALRSHQYGNYYFCWISIHESVIWAMIGPGVVIIATKLIVLFMSLKAAFTVNSTIVTYGNLRTMLWVDVGCLPLLVASWLSVLVNASNHSPWATIGMALIIPIHSAALLVSVASTSPSLRRIVLRLAGRKVTGSEPRSSSPPSRSAMAYRPANVVVTSPDSVTPVPPAGPTSPGTRRPLGISNSSTTSRSTVRTSSSPYSRSDARLRHTSTSTSFEASGTGKRRDGQTSDSESEGSERSLELASSHSSDEETSRRVSTLNSSDRRWPGQTTVSYPPRLNIDSEIFKAVYDIDGNGRGGEEPPPHRWTSSTVSDNEIGAYSTVPAAGPLHHLRASDVKLSNVYSDHEDKASLGDKYLFPYTAEEDHSLNHRPPFTQHPPAPSYLANSPSPLAMHTDYIYPDISETEKTTSETHV